MVRHCQDERRGGLHSHLNIKMSFTPAFIVKYNPAITRDMTGIFILEVADTKDPEDGFVITEKGTGHCVTLESCLFSIYSEN